jgi:eukaryotic-like serine/threonine-protein kinase
MSDFITAKELFADALEVDPSERETFIQRACGDNAALMADVLGLVATHEKARNFLNMRAITGLPVEVKTPGEGPGTLIGNYKLRELIGEGGFGSVFLAEQERPVRRRVALKIIKLGMDTRTVVARFEQERQALAVMDHPNIARVLDAGATETGRPYFVMELVKGEPITKYCDKHSLTVDERLELFTQVCQAVQHAHTKGVIHRDIKPNNILVTVQDGRAVARVIDFGIAKATDHRLTEKTVFTEFRQLIGTPEYMSPEQAEGSLDIDTRTDVYSLGVLLYELLTGSTPFDGKDLRSAAYAEMQRIIREVEPPRPSTRLQQSRETLANVAAQRRVEPARLGTIVRGELDWIVMKALDKDRSRRYATPGDLASDIRRHLSGEAVTAAPPTKFYRARKLVSRHKGLVVAASLVAGALMVGAVGTAAFAFREHRARGRAEEAEGQAKASAADLRKVAEFQKSQLRDIAPERLADLLRTELLAQTRSAMESAKATPEEVDGATEQLRSLLTRPNLTNVAVKLLDGGLLERSVRAVDEQFRDQPLVRAELLQTLAETMTNLGLVERAEVPQTTALEIRRRELGNAHADTIASINCAGTYWEARGRLDLAAPLIEEAYALSRKELGETHEETLGALTSLGSLRMVQGKHDEAEALQREAIDLSRRVLGENHPETAGNIGNLAFTLGARNKFEEAVKLFEESLAIRRRALGEDHPDTLESLNNVAFMLVDAGRPADAERLFREAAEGRRRVLGDDHPATIRAVNNIGSALRAQGKGKEAEEYFRRAYEARRRTVGADHIETVQSLANLGVAIAGNGRHAEAYPMYKEAYERKLQVLGPDNPSTMSAMSNLGVILDTMDRLDEAEPYVRGAYEARLRHLGPEASDTQTSQQNYATLLQRQKKFAEAEPIYLDLLQKRRKAPGPTHSRTLNTAHALGTLMFEMGRYSEAAALLKEALDGRKGHPTATDSRYWYAKTLLAEGKHAEAEREALVVESELAGLTGPNAVKHTRSVELLTSVYDSWHRAEPGKDYDSKAAEWRLKAAPPAR